MHKKRIARLLGTMIFVSNASMAFADNIEDTNVDSNEPNSSYTLRASKLGTGEVTATLTVRQGPSKEYSQMGYLPKGTKVELLEKDSATGWYKIEYKGSYGYISNKYVKVDTTTDGETGGQTGGQTGGATGGTQNPTVIKTGKTTATLNVRKGPATSYTSIGSLAINTKVEIVEVDNATGWYKIKYNGSYGYVSNKYVKLDVTTGEETGGETGGATGGTQNPTVIKTGKTTATLNVRKGPATSYTSLGKLSINIKVEIVEIDKTTGWYKIKYGNDYGYVSNQYVILDGVAGGQTGGDRVYQNPSQYFQIQNNISFAGQGGYVLKSGTMGLKVRMVQQKLGMGTSNKAIMGPTTISKVKAFQKKKGLPQTGIVDYTTWKALGLSDYDWNYLGSYVSPITTNKNSTRQDYIESMIARATEYLGTEYIVGAAGKPGQGIDCSGLVMQSLYSVGINPLPSSVIRHSQPGYEYESANLYKSSKLKKVSYSERQRGDLIFYANSNGVIIHVAIYLGNDKVIEAWPTKVVIWPIKNSHRSIIAGVRRVFN